ncbi:carbohydrate ABC transporter permease [Novisyntrophococcus fermenticellae]|uniref:carbohydrate ABC transporter permease n=1 Tax=Novisyntrophococcus fermenticellae TaxID=2068655 RepID=UPI001E6136BC|nr:sugar ABC transporter permease [Novisyntrophococcus fermenticellae]
MAKRMTAKQFLFILPLLIFIGIFSLYPIVTSLMYTLFDYRTNDQQHNSFYMSRQLNEELYAQDLGYVNYFIDTDKMTDGLNSEDVAEFEAIQADVTGMLEKYEGSKGVSKVASDVISEVESFNTDIRERLMAIYDRNESLDMYNREGMPQILDEMDSCIVNTNFTGLQAYGKLIHDTRFFKALGHTMLFTVISVAIELVIGMLLALIMNKAMRGIGFIRTTALIPWAIPTAVSAMIWSYMYDGSYGVISKIFSMIGLIPKQSAMLLTSSGAMTSVIISDVWKTAPYMALLLLAGLQVIDRGLYESASIDGAGPFRTFFRITLPLLKPSILVALLFRTMDAFRVYDLIAILTGGGPGNGTESLSVYSYKLMFGQSNYGYGSVVVMGMAVCVAIIAILYVKVLGAEVVNND